MSKAGASKTPNSKKTQEVSPKSPKPKKEGASGSKSPSQATRSKSTSADTETRGKGAQNPPQAHNPLILRFHRLVDAFSKADDERDFYLDRHEGFLLFCNLDKSEVELEVLQRELLANRKRYCSIPKLSFYEQKKLMEGFVNEKIYDIDTKEKLSDIISSKNPRENFLEYLLDLHLENEKWQAYFQERFRIKIIEWLRAKDFNFVFEEDLEMHKELLERLKKNLFIQKAPKDVLKVRLELEAKASTYYQSEALNPRPKRGRPPKQIIKVEVQPQISADIFTTVPTGLYPFLYVPDLNSPSMVTFSSRFGSHEELAEHFRATSRSGQLARLEALTQKLSHLQDLGKDQAVETTVGPNPIVGGSHKGSGLNGNGSSAL